MRRNQIFAFALAAVTGAHSASAQQQHPAGGHEQHSAEGRRQGGGPFQRYFQGVELTAAQQQQVREIFQEGRPERGARQQGQRGGERPQPTAEQRAEFQKHRQEMEARRAQQIARIRDILTAEQRTRFDRNVAQMDARRREQADRRRQGGEQRTPRAAGRQS